MADIDYLTQHCPIEVVEYVPHTNPRDPVMTLWPNDDFYGETDDENCKIAVLDYYSDGIGAYSHTNWDTGYLWVAIDYIDKASPAVQRKVHDAMRRLIASDKPIAGGI